MKVYIADEASPVVSRYKNVGKVDFSVRLLLTANGSAASRARIMALACRALSPRTLFVDSGAFILGSGFYKHGKKPSELEAENILRQHLGACLELAKRGYPLAGVAELDVPTLYTQDVVEKWRHKYMLPFQEASGVPVVFGWHGYEDFEDLVSQPWCQYVGTSMGYGRKQILSDWGSMEKFYSGMRDLVKLAFDYGVKMHGYAVTRTSALKEVPFYSVDSVSWQQALHFGGIIAFDKSTGDLVRFDVGRGFVKKKGIKAAAYNLAKAQRFGCRLSLLDVLGRKNAKGQIRPDHEAIFRDQAKVFADMERWYTVYWKNKGVDWAEMLGEEDDTVWQPSEAVTVPPRIRRMLW